MRPRLAALLLVGCGEEGGTFTEVAAPPEAAAEAPTPTPAPAESPPPTEPPASSPTTAPVDAPAADDAPDTHRLAEASVRYDDAEGAEMARRLQAELSVLGKPAPKLSVAWVQGRGALDAPATVVVFFAPEHPDAPAAVNALQALVTREGARLGVVGVTPMSDPATPAWLRERGVTFPVAVDRAGATAQAWRRSSTVSAALVVGGKVAWTGNPTRVDPALLDKHLRTPAP